MQRIDLYVSPEDYGEVAARGACWDEQVKCWYLPAGREVGPFRAWLDDQGDDPARFTIRSVAAYVVRARWWCAHCHAPMPVIGIYCRRGRAWGEQLARFGVHHVWRVDAALARQLARWRDYRPDARLGCYLNHCPRCRAPLQDEQLHAEPGQPFFDLRRGVRLTRLRGRVRLCGDVSVDA